MFSYVSMHIGQSRGVFCFLLFFCCADAISYSSPPAHWVPDSIMQNLTSLSIELWSTLQNPHFSCCPLLIYAQPSPPSFSYLSRLDQCCRSSLHLCCLPLNLHIAHLNTLVALLCNQYCTASLLSVAPYWSVLHLSTPYLLPLVGQWSALHSCTE